MLTSEMADRLLTVLVNEAPVAKLVRDNNVAKLLEKTGLEPNELDALLDEFRDCGLIKEYNLRNNVIGSLLLPRLRCCSKPEGSRDNCRPCVNSCNCSKPSLKTCPSTMQPK